MSDGGGGGGAAAAAAADSLGIYFGTAILCGLGFTLLCRRFGESEI